MTDDHIERAQMRATDAAEQEVLQDLDSFAEWIYGELSRKNFDASLQPQYVDFDGLTVAQCFAYLLQWPSSGVMPAAIQIRDRYLADNAARIKAIAADRYPAVLEEIAEGA